MDGFFKKIISNWKPIVCIFLFGAICSGAAEYLIISSGTDGAIAKLDATIHSQSGTIEQLNTTIGGLEETEAELRNTNSKLELTNSRLGQDIQGLQSGSAAITITDTSIGESTQGLADSIYSAYEGESKLKARISKLINEVKHTEVIH